MEQQYGPIELQCDLVIPNEVILQTAREHLNASSEQVRCVAKAILDLTDVTRSVKEALAANRSCDLSPYFDFWFADAIPAATALQNSPEKYISYMAKCLLKQEQAVDRSRRIFLIEMKRRGLTPQHWMATRASGDADESTAGAG